MKAQESSPDSFWSRCAGSTPRDRGNLRRVLWSCLGWALLFLAASQLLKHSLVSEGPVSWILAAMPVVASLLVAAAYARFLREADELQRVIHLEGMALGFGGGFLGIVGWSLFERIGGPVADIGDAAVFLALFYSVGIVRATWRYR